MYLATAIKYANDLLSSKIKAANITKLAAKRFLADIQNSAYYVDEKKLDQVTQFCNMLSISESKKLKLLPWQIFVVANLYGIRRVDNGCRKYSQAYIEISRKNGKSSFASALSLYNLIFESEDNKEIVLVANSANQVKETLYKPTKYFAKKLDKKGKDLKIFYRDIQFRDSKLMMIASDPSTLDGLRISHAFIDELHAHPNGEVYGVIKTAMGSSEDPLLLVITTAGLNTSSFCYELRCYLVDVLIGSIEDDSQFALIYTLDEEKDIDDKSNWVKSNPSIGETIKESFLEQEYKKYQNFESEKVNVLVKDFNLWATLGKTDSWLELSYIKNAYRKLNIDDYLGCQIYVAFDLSTTRDLTALSWLIKDVEGSYIFFNKSYLPKESRNSKLLNDFMNELSRLGQLQLTEGNVVDYDALIDDIIFLNENFKIMGVFYDSYNATQLNIDLTGMGLPMYPYSQTLASFNQPTKEFERLLLTNHVIIDSGYEKNITYQFNNVTLEFDNKGNCKPTKVRKGNRQERLKIDNVITMLMCLGGSMQV